MNNAHYRIAVVEYRSESTHIRLFTDRFITSIPVSNDATASDVAGQLHLLSVFGGDSEISAFRAAIAADRTVKLAAPAQDPLYLRFGESAVVYRGALYPSSRRRPVKHLVVVSADLCAAPSDAEPSEQLVLVDDDPGFILSRMARFYGLPVIPDWADWMLEKLTSSERLVRLVGLNSSGVLIKGRQAVFLDWIQAGLRAGDIEFPAQPTLAWPQRRHFGCASTV